LLLDEPTLGLAPALVDRVFDLIGELREQGLTVLVVDQNAVRAAEAAHRSYVMRTGEVVATGTAEELGGSDGLMRAYLGGARQGPA
jgi:branched-chain amino acid transport system ATP-binding protein